jgi:hypothetical protein
MRWLVSLYLLATILAVSQPLLGQTTTPQVFHGVITYELNAYFESAEDHTLSPLLASLEGKSYLHY